MTIPHITEAQHSAMFPESTLTHLQFLNKQIDRANAKAEQSEYITAEQARALGAGNAEWLSPCDGQWRTCSASWGYSKTVQNDGVSVIKYRAIKKPTDSHAEMKALYAQQVADGTLDDFVWTYSENDGRSWGSLLNLTPSWRVECKYKCTPKPTCQVQLIDGFQIGEVITMTREAAKALQAETNPTHHWVAPYYTKPFDVEGFISDFAQEGIYTYRLKQNLVKLDGELMSREAAIAKYEAVKDTHDVWYGSEPQPEPKKLDVSTWLPFATEQGEYQLHPKAKKVISWKDMPNGIRVGNTKDLGNGNPSLYMTLIGVNITGKRRHLWCKNEVNFCTYGVGLDDAELAPSSEQPWLNWRGGDCPVPEGVIVEVTMRNGGFLKFNGTNLIWNKSDLGGDIIEYRVVGIDEDNYELGGGE